MKINYGWIFLLFLSWKLLLIFYFSFVCDLTDVSLIATRGLGFCVIFGYKPEIISFFFVFISSMGDEIVNNNDRNDGHDTKFDGNFIFGCEV